MTGLTPEEIREFEQIEDSPVVRHREVPGGPGAFAEGIRRAHREEPDRLVIVDIQDRQVGPPETIDPADLEGFIDVPGVLSINNTVADGQSETLNACGGKHKTDPSPVDEFAARPKKQEGPQESDGEPDD